MTSKILIHLIREIRLAAHGRQVIDDEDIQDEILGQRKIGRWLWYCHVPTLEGKLGASDRSIRSKVYLLKDLKLIVPFHRFRQGGILYVVGFGDTSSPFVPVAICSSSCFKRG